MGGDGETALICLKLMDHESLNLCDPWWNLLGIEMIASM